MLGLCTIVHCVITMINCFMKSDFINLSVGILLLHVTYNNGNLKKWHFRLIVLTILLSWVYDLVWLFFHLGSWWS